MKDFANKNYANEKKSIILKINSFLDRFKRFIDCNKTFNIILILSSFYFNSIRKRYKYIEARIKRRLSFSIKNNIYITSLNDVNDCRVISVSDSNFNKILIR